MQWGPCRRPGDSRPAGGTTADTVSAGSPTKESRPGGPDRLSLERNPSLDHRLRSLPRSLASLDAKSPNRYLASHTRPCPSISSRLPRARQPSPARSPRRVSHSPQRSLARLIDTRVTSSPWGVMLSDCLQLERVTLMAALKAAPWIERAKLSPPKRPVTSPLAE